MKAHEQLKDFLKTGHLKNIDYGVTRDELTMVFGDTDWKHYSSGRDKYPTIYKYGRLEFYFESKSKHAKLSGIMFQPIPAAADKGKLQCTYHGLRRNTEISQLIEFLNANDIQFEEKPCEGDNEAKLLLTEGKVKVFLIVSRHSDTSFSIKLVDSLTVDIWWKSRYKQLPIVE
jgi:hypothetical protein